MMAARPARLSLPLHFRQPRGRSRRARRPGHVVRRHVLVTVSVVNRVLVAQRLLPVVVGTRYTGKAGGEMMTGGTSGGPPGGTGGGSGGAGDGGGSGGFGAG